MSEQNKKIPSDISKKPKLADIETYCEVMFCQTSHFETLFCDEWREIQKKTTSQRDVGKIVTPH